MSLGGRERSESRDGLENDERVARYLRAVCRGIRSRRKRSEVAQELLSHLTEAVESKRAEGMEPGQALESALNDLGPTPELARQLAYAHRPLILRLPFLMAILSCVGLVTVIYLVESARGLMARARQDQLEMIAQHEARFLEDQRILASGALGPIFDFPGKERDAGPVLNERVSWENGLKMYPDLFPPKPSLTVSKETADLLAKKEWLQAHADFRKFDTSWLHDLLRYDHWDLFESGPLKRLFDKEPSQNFWSLPVPDYRALQIWAKLRLLQAVHGDHPLEGFREVRQLGRLIYSNQLLVASMVYVAILNAERDAYEEAVRRHVLAPGAWTPLGKDDALRARRTMYAYPSLFDVWTEPSSLVKYFSGNALLRAGMCSAITERLPSLALDRLFYGDVAMFSGELNDRFLAIDDALSRADPYCRVGGHFRQVWNHPELAAPWMNLSNLSGVNLWEVFRWVVLARIPYVRTWVGADLESISRPNFMNGPYRNILLPGESPI